MPDNPIKHSDIIQSGNPFDQAIKGIEQLLRLFKQLDKEIKSTGKDLITFTNKQNTSTKEGRKNLQSAAKATGELSVKEKELIKIKQQLEREQAKLANMSSQEYRDLIKTKQAIKSKNAELIKTAKVMVDGRKSTNTWGKALGSFAAKFNTIGNVAAMVAAKIQQSISKAIRSAVDIVVKFDQAMADTKSITGATNKEFVALAKSARSLGGSTKFTATEVAKLQKEYAKLGFTTKEIIDAQGATLDMAAATNTELPRAAEVVGVTIRQFGLAANEARRVTDVMARSFSTSALDMEKFAEAMKMAGPAARVSGLSLERTTAMLGQLANAGITGTMAGTALRNIMLAMARESGTLSEKIARVSEKGLDLAGATDEVQRRAATALLVLADGVGTIDSFTESLEGAAGAAGDMADIQLNTLAGQATLVKSAWEGMVLSMLYSEDNLNGVKWALRGIVDQLNIMAIRAEYGFSRAASKAIVKATREATEWALEVQRGNKAFDEFVGGFKNFKENFKGFGKDLWNGLFPKQSADQAKTDLEDITELVKNLKDELILDEDEQEAALQLWTLPPGTKEQAQKNLDDVVEANRKATEDQVKISEESAKKQAEDKKNAEELKQKKIEETFALSERLTSTFSDIFAAQKAKELSAVGDNAEKRAEIEKKYAKREQALAISQAIIDGARSLLKTKASLGLPAAIPFMIADAAITAAQIGILASQKFEEGGSGLLDDKGGVLQGKRHAQGGVNLGSIGEAERGEYFGIINRRMTQKYARELPMVFDSLNNGAFHEVWGRTKVNNVDMNYNDPWTKKMYDLMEKTPIYGPSTDRVEYYPSTGKKRIING